ncbi:MAG: hypothetical protein AB8I08_38990 [Sandaracinaceae bacterium]
MANEVRFSGAVLEQHRQLLRERLGDRFDAVVEGLPDAERTVIEETLAMGWVDYRSLRALYEAAGDALGVDPHRLHEEVVTIAVRRTFNSVWRILLRVVSEGTILKRVPRMFKRGYDGGRIETEYNKAGAALVRVTEFPDAGSHPYARRGLTIAVREILTIAGRKGVRVESKPTSDGVVLHVRWKA